MTCLFDKLFGESNFWKMAFGNWFPDNSPRSDSISIKEWKNPGINAENAYRIQTPPYLLRKTQPEQRNKSGTF